MTVCLAISRLAWVSKLLCEGFRVVFYESVAVTDVNLVSQQSVVNGSA